MIYVLAALSCLILIVCLAILSEVKRVVENHTVLWGQFQDALVSITDRAKASEAVNDRLSFSLEQAVKANASASARDLEAQFLRERIVVLDKRNEASENKLMALVDASAQRQVAIQQLEADGKRQKEQPTPSAHTNRWATRSQVIPKPMPVVKTE